MTGSTDDAVCGNNLQGRQALILGQKLRGPKFLGRAEKVICVLRESIGCKVVTLLG